MPTVTVEGNVTLQQAATALQDKLGSRYEVSLRHPSRQLTVADLTTVAPSTSIVPRRPVQPESARGDGFAGGLYYVHTGRRSSCPLSL
jgi:hypothetical protein